MWVIQRNSDGQYYQQDGDHLDLPETFTPDIAHAYVWPDEMKDMVFIYPGESWVWVPETDIAHTD
jgi:hypothetical protein